MSYALTLSWWKGTRRWFFCTIKRQCRSKRGAERWSYFEKRIRPPTTEETCHLRTHTPCFICHCLSHGPEHCAYQSRRVSRICRGPDFVSCEVGHKGFLHRFSDYKDGERVSDGALSPKWLSCQQCTARTKYGHSPIRRRIFPNCDYAYGRDQYTRRGAKGCAHHLLEVRNPLFRLGSRVIEPRSVLGLTYAHCDSALSFHMSYWGTCMLIPQDGWD